MEEKNRQSDLAEKLSLKKAVNDANFIEYSKFLDEIRESAAKNGLTPEILEDILSSDGTES